MLRHHTYEEDPRLAIIVPILNEREGLETLLDHLETWRQRGAEIIVVDGGSDDKSDSLIEARGFPLLRSARGRATQMNAGELQNHDACLCPVADGGYALLGLRRFSPALFTDIPWSTEQVAAITRQRLAALGWRLAESETLNDVDEPADLQRLATDYPGLMMP